ncbi:MAG: AsmA-like C-terminal domain-containing protein [Bdellovibrionales bacterium]|jgi:hypothetical protein
MTDAPRIDILRAMARALSFVFKLLAFLFLLLLLAAVGLAWRFIADPVTTTRLTPYIESVFERLIPHTTAKVGASTLQWDEKNLTLTLTCEDVQLNNKEGVPVLSFPKTSLKMSLGHYLRGRILPSEFTADRAHFWLVRGLDGVLSFGTAQDDDGVGRTDRSAASVLSFLQNIADEVSNDRLQHKIAIKDVVLSLHDLKTTQKWDMMIPEITLDHDHQETKAKASILVSEKDRTSAVQLTYGFDYKEKQHQVILAFQDIRLSSFVSFDPLLAPLKGAEFPVSGSLVIKTDRDLAIAEANAKITGGAGTLVYPDLWEKPRSLQHFVFEAAYDRKKEGLTVPRAEIDFGGPKLFLTAQAEAPSPKNALEALWNSRKKQNNSFSATVMLDDVPMDQFGSLWPKSVIPDAYLWMTANMSKGVFTHGEVTVKGMAKLDDLENVVLESGGGFIDAKDGRITYLEGMPAVDEALAHATFDLDHMDVQILAGHTGPIKLLPFTIVMDHFQEDIQTITIPAKIQGPISNVLTLLDSPPLGYAKEVGLDPKDSVGTVEGVLTLQMPMLDSLLLKDVEVKANAALQGFGAQKLVSGIILSQGNLDLDVTKDGFGLKGGIALNKVPAKVEWKSNFHSDGKKPLNEAVVTASLKNDQWDAFYGLGNLVKVQGETPVMINYQNIQKGLSKIQGKVSLTPAAVQIKSIAWQKSAGAAAQFSFALDLEEGKNLAFKSIDLQGTGIRVKGTASLDAATSQLVSFDAIPFIVGRSNASVHYDSPVDPSLPLTIKVAGEAFDISGFTSDKENAPLVKRPKNYDLKVTKLYTSEKGFMASLSGHAQRDQEGWRDIDLWGVAQGSTPVHLRLEQKDGRALFKFKSDNFGMALMGLGFSDGVKGGEIEINGEGSADAPRAVDGKIKISSFTVSDLPVLARLLSAVSPFGFVDLITGDASFDHLLGHFHWHGDQVDLRDVRAAGSVVGINLDGRVNMDASEANLNGTLVPFSFMNSIIGYIPLLGDVITGGSGQGVIAASFTVKGPLSNMDVSVNPISLLTPGILRNIFFSGDEEQGAKTEEIKKP